MAKAPAAAAAAHSAARARHIRLVARRILEGTANPEGAGLLLRGREYQPSLVSDFDPLVLNGLMRMARLAGTVADARGVIVALTDAGVVRLTETATVHLRGVSDLFVTQLDDQELAALTNALDKVTVDCTFG